MLYLTDKPQLYSINTKNWLSMNTRYLVEVNFTFDLSVQVDSFKGQSHFCVRKDQLNDFVSSFSKLPFETLLEDNDSDAFLKVKSTDTDVLMVEGQLGGSHEACYLKFSFETHFEQIESFSLELQKLLLFVDNPEAEERYEEFKKANSGKTH